MVKLHPVDNHIRNPAEPRLVQGRTVEWGAPNVSANQHMQMCCAPFNRFAHVNQLARSFLGVVSWVWVGSEDSRDVVTPVRVLPRGGVAAMDS